MSLPFSRKALAKWIESDRVQTVIIGVIIFNAILLGVETDATIMARWGPLLRTLDLCCLIIFVAEILIKISVHRLAFWRDGWNLFDFFVIAVALVPNAGPWSVLRALRVLRVLRLLTVVPSLRKVVAAFLHSIPGIAGVLALMSIVFYTAAVLATRLFGADFPDWFGSIGKSLYSLFQIMTLESWSMGIVRPVMEIHPWAWIFFVPFIVVATFTILNLFLGIIVSTMQELATLPDPKEQQRELKELLRRMDDDMKALRILVENPPPNGNDE